MADPSLHFFELTTPLGPDVLHLERIRGEERISGMFHLGLEMVSENLALDLASLIGQSVTVGIRLADDGTDHRYLNGVVGRVAQGGTREGWAIYYADVYPWLWLLDFDADCRIFQDQSVPDIVEEILGDPDLDALVKDKVRIDRSGLTATYEPRAYTVQYDETTLAFIDRLLAGAGIAYYFQHAEDQHTLVLVDDPSSLEVAPGGAEIEYGSAGEYVLQNRLTSCTWEDKVIPGKAAMVDFDFENAPNVVTAEVASVVAGDLEVFEYPGGFLTSDEGALRAANRIESYESQRQILRADTRAPALVPGFKFTLKGHYRSELNREYYVGQVSYQAAVGVYQNQIVAYPSDVPYRPSSTYPRPTIAGAQTALVVGPAGEEIYNDAYGRVKVQFHWDRVGVKDENSSCWIRVAHGWAGKSWGWVSTPRIGQEVVVTFENGDPDRPLVTGSVYNAEQTVPYVEEEPTKSAWKSATSPGGPAEGYNEIRFEDKAGEEEVFVQAQKDMKRVVKNDDVLEVGLETQDPGDQTIDVFNTEP